MIVSQSKFARITDRTRQAIFQRVKRGTLVADKHGKMDTEDPINAEFIEQIEGEKKIKEFNDNPNKVQKPKQFNNHDNSEPKINYENSFSQNVSKAKSGQEILKYKKLELEVKLLQGELVRKDSVADICFGYLSALNINIMETPQSFLDELEGAILNKSSRSNKIEIVTKPICAAISNTILQIEKKINNSNTNEY